MKGIVVTTCKQCDTRNEFKIKDSQKEYVCSNYGVLLVENTKNKVKKNKKKNNKKKKKVKKIKR